MFFFFFTNFCLHLWLIKFYLSKIIILIIFFFCFLRAYVLKGQVLITLKITIFLFIMLANLYIRFCYFLFHFFVFLHVSLFFLIIKFIPRTFKFDIFTQVNTCRIFDVFIYNRARKRGKRRERKVIRRRERERAT